ncbi:MAG TPA: hypothetical protein VF932_06715 [Anaerolineae bacterium]
MSTLVTLFLFVKGVASSPVEDLVARAQCAVALDTLDKLRAIPEVGAMIVSTANSELAARASALGAHIEMDLPGEDFHFGRRLASLVAAHRAAVPLYVGGGSGALMRVEDWQSLARKILGASDTVVTNNFYSCDFAGWSPGEAIGWIAPPELDNDLAYRLGERGGLEVIPLAKDAASQLDIDTPSDLFTLSFHPAVGANLRAFLDSVRLDTMRAGRIRSLLATRTATMLVAGRVSASMALFLERETRCQWRIYSEERGMRASGREKRGEARSLLGHYLDRVGAVDFFATLARMADGALLDSRVLFAHRGLRPPAPDRFNSDLLHAEAIQDEFIRSFTAAARDAPIPVLLGGHSLVSGGMYALAEQ